MAVTVAQFRADFPEFANVATYTPTQVQMYIDLFDEAFKGPRWGAGKLADYGTELFVAHNLTLEMEAQRMAARGQNPGQIIAPLTGGTVDKVSYQRSMQSILDPSAGHWNLSQYGLRYIRLVNMVGAGPVQVGPVSDGTGLVYPFAGPFFPPNYP